MKILSKIKAAIFGATSYLDFITDENKYSRILHCYVPDPVYVYRQQLLRQCVQNYLSKVFGEEFDLKKFDTGNESVYSVIDHHDILNHPSFIYPNIVGNLFRFKKGNTKPSAIVTITDSGIPADHFGNRRGMQFHNKKFRLFSHKERHRISFGAGKLSSFTFSKQAVEKWCTSEEIDYFTQIDQLLYSCSQHPGVVSYDSQVTFTNNILWKQLFKESERGWVPELFHVSGEEITSSLLEIYVSDSSNIFYKILFDQNVRNMTLNIFDTLSGCWNTKTLQGTHFFWLKNNKGESEKLWLRDSTLSNREGTERIKLTPENIIRLLRDKTIYPCLFLVYGVLIFYCGIKPLTGGRSTDAITSMKSAWLKIASEEEVELIRKIPVSNQVQYCYDGSYSLDTIYRKGFTVASLKRGEKIRLYKMWFEKIRNYLRVLLHLV